jgi:hypothetical protein
LQTLLENLRVIRENTLAYFIVKKLEGFSLMAVTLMPTTTSR